MPKSRGLYYIYKSKRHFVSCLSLNTLIEELDKVIVLSSLKKEELTDALYTLVANYDINTECCWLQVSDQETKVSLTWGISDVLDKQSLTVEAIAATYYVWKKAKCTPEEASKILDIPMETLMALAEKFSNLTS
jgi:hypothetical protein